MSEEGSDLEIESNEGEENEGGESEPEEPEEPVKVEAPPPPAFTPRRIDPLSNVMNINKELDFLGSQINHTCTMLKYNEYG